jgi:hypothetical protein
VKRTQGGENDDEHAQFPIMIPLAMTASGHTSSELVVQAIAEGLECMQAFVTEGMRVSSFSVATITFP